MSHPEREALAGALGELVRSAAEEAGARYGATSRTRLLERVEQLSAERRPRPGRWRVAMAAVAAIAAAVLVLAWRLKPAALTYEVLGSEKDGVYVSAPDERPVTVQFSDATTLQVAAGSRLRIDGVSARGARVLVERGATNARVVHKDGTRWTFAAGPFDVTVTGTRFDLTWDPSLEVFDLKMLEGTVDIQTPFSAAPLSLRSGQAVHADLRARTITTSEPHEAKGTSAVDPRATASAEGPTLEGEDGGGTASVAATPAAATGPGRHAPSRAHAGKTWSALVAAGQFGAVLAQVDERGVDACVRGCSASDLRAVADAARYTGRAELAERSLRALVARFGQEPGGPEATFLLGRVLEQRGDPSQARSWYERYRSAEPDGAYGAEALAGIMRTTLARDGRPAARRLAQEYLARYPAGADAATARGILGPP